MLVGILLSMWPVFESLGPKYQTVVLINLELGTGTVRCEGLLFVVNSYSSSFRLSLQKRIHSMECPVCSNILVRFSVSNPVF